MSGCPCGRVHSRRGKARLNRPRQPEDQLDRKVYAALVDGIATRDPSTGFWWVALHSDCKEPIVVTAHRGTMIVKRLCRCRRCSTCRRAKANYWAFAAVEQSKIAAASGGRTWFGTLTLSKEAHEIIAARAERAAADPSIDWDNLECDTRFAHVRDQLVIEVRRYWARLRKAGYRFKYLLVFERHKGGGEAHNQPHMHFLLHEQNGPIRKRVLEEQWPHGHAGAKLVGSAKRQVPMKQAAFYCAKYLSKDSQARQIASKGYRPQKRADHKGKNDREMGSASDSEAANGTPSRKSE